MQDEVITMLREIRELTLLGSKKVLTIKDVSLLLDRSPKTIYNMLDELPHYRNGKGIYFKKSDIEQWMLGIKKLKKWKS